VIEAVIDSHLDAHSDTVIARATVSFAILSLPALR